MSLFKEIQSDSDVCGNCFRKQRERYERNYRLEPVEEDGEWTVKPFQVSGIELTKPDGSTETVKTKPDDVHRDYDNTDKIPQRGSHRGMVTVCECGFRWAPEHEIEEWKDRPLDKRKFFSIADRILQRVRETGADIDEDKYYQWLDEAKSNPDHQFADDTMFRRAVEYALQSGEK